MDWLDTTRGFAMLLVFWGHIASRSSVFKNAIYCFSAPLLFFMSGYLFRIRPNERFGDFAKKKVKSIVLPCTWLCVAIILFSMVWQRSTAPLSMVKLLFLQTRPSWPTWYMACLFVLNLYMFLFVRFTDRMTGAKRIYAIIGINLAAVALGMLFYSLPAAKNLPWYDGIVCLPWNSDIALMALPFFSVAFYAAKNGWVDKVSEFLLAKTKHNVILYELVCLLGLCISSAIGLYSGRLCGMNWSLDMYYNDYTFVPLTYLSGFIGSYFVFLAWRPYPVKFLQTIGKHSVIYFAWHLQIFFPILKHFIDPLAIPQDWKDILLLISTCLLAEAVYQFLELTGTGRIFGVKASVQADSDQLWNKPIQIGKRSMKRRTAALAALCVFCFLGAGLFGLKKIYGHEHQMNERLGEIKASTDRIPELADALRTPDNPQQRMMQTKLYEAVSRAVSEGQETDAFTSIACGKDVRMLFVGDSIGAQEWSESAGDWIEEQYGISCEVKNICMGWGTSFTGYARLHMLEEEEPFDIAVICFGQNDSPVDFAWFYETVIRTLLDDNPNCCLFSVLESSQRAYTEKIQEIIRLAAYYDIPVIDTLAAYEQSEYSYDTLSPDTIHPGPLGQDLYLQAFTEAFGKQVDAAWETVSTQVSKALTGTPLTWNLSLNRHFREQPDDPRVYDLEQFLYLPVEGFTRVDDLTYIREDVHASGLPGVFYWVVPGDNRMQIYADDQLLYDLAENFYHYNTQSRIELLDKNKITVDGRITVVFDSKEQADGFRGLTFSNSVASAEKS